MKKIDIGLLIYWTGVILIFSSPIAMALIMGDRKIQPMSYEARCNTICIIIIVIIVLKAFKLFKK